VRKERSLYFFPRVTVAAIRAAAKVVFRLHIIIADDVRPCVSVSDVLSNPLIANGICAPDFEGRSSNALSIGQRNDLF